MATLNGNSANGTTMDYRKAAEVLKNEYERRDGISAQELIDSKSNGGLTYNDFLMLPGYIGMSSRVAHFFWSRPDKSHRLRCRRGVP
jgi:IMP dehydrogenase